MSTFTSAQKAIVDRITATAPGSVPEQVAYLATALKVAGGTNQPAPSDAVAQAQQALLTKIEQQAISATDPENLAYIANALSIIGTSTTLSEVRTITGDMLRVVTDQTNSLGAYIQSVRLATEDWEAKFTAARDRSILAETNSKASETASKASETAAKTSETNAAGSATTANTRATAASTSATQANNWANAAEDANANGAGTRSANHHAIKAGKSATAAAGSATNAANSATAAAGSATDANTAKTGSETARDASNASANRSEAAANRSEAADISQHVPAKGNVHDLRIDQALPALPSTGSTLNDGRKSKHLAMFRGAANQSVTGAIAFISPAGIDARVTMMQLKIEGHLYSPTQVVDLTTDVYLFDPTQVGSTGPIQWLGGKVSMGSLDVQLRFARLDNRVVIILGDVNTVWSYPIFSLEGMGAGSRATDALFSSWGTTIVTDLSIYADLSANVATSHALSAKANLASPTFSGTPTVPTPATGSNNQQIANTNFVTIAAANAVAPKLDTAATTPFTRTLLDDTSAGAFFTSLGISNFVQSILDDPTDAQVRATIGLGNVLNAGPVSQFFEGAKAVSTMELGQLLSGDRTVVLDLHASGDPGTLDYSARFGRAGGVNGALFVQNTGTGNIQYQTGGGLHAFNNSIQTVGRLLVGAGAASSFIEMHDSDDGIRYIHNNGGLLGFLGNDGNWTFRVADDGKVWTKQFGDLDSRIEARAAAFAAARLALIGGTLTGTVSLEYANPAIRWVNSGSRAWYLQATGTNFRIVDETGNYEHTTFHPNGNVTFNNIPGYGARALSTIMGEIAARAVLVSRFNVQGVQTGAGSLAMSTSNHVDFHWNNGFYYRVDGNSYVLINSASSDERFKNVEGEIEDGLETVLRLNPVRYEFRDDTPIYTPKGSRAGFLAQELEKVLPAIVEDRGIPDDENGATFKALSEDAAFQLIAHMASAIKTLEKRVRELENGKRD